MANKNITVDLTGLRFGRYVVIAFSERPKTGQGRWLCRCDCGTERILSLNLSTIKNDTNRSCRCRLKERLRNYNATRTDVLRMAHTSEYKTWAAMKKRCYNSNDPNYKNYGGRGITVCDRWRESFANFFADMGWRPHKDLSLERIDNNGNYCPENCKWATKAEQCSNHRRNRWIEFRGEKKTATQWAKELGIRFANIVTRSEKGWPLDTPVDKRMAHRTKEADRLRELNMWMT